MTTQLHQQKQQQKQTEIPRWRLMTLEMSVSIVKVKVKRKKLMDNPKTQAAKKRMKVARNCKLRNPLWGGVFMSSLDQAWTDTKKVLCTPWISCLHSVCETMQRSTRLHK